MTTLLADLRLALRTCTRTPGFTVVVLVTLALGIGANTTIFSLVYAVLLRPFPYVEPQQLVRIRTELGRKTGNLHEASIFDARDWREQNQSFQDLAVYWSFVNTLSGDGPAQSVLMTFATPQLFPVLGVQPMLGRVFTDEENRIGGGINKVILSHGLVSGAQRRLGAADVALRVLPDALVAGPECAHPQRHWPAQRRDRADAGPSRPGRDRRPPRARLRHHQHGRTGPARLAA